MGGNPGVLGMSRESRRAGVVWTGIEGFWTVSGGTTGKHLGIHRPAMRVGMYKDNKGFLSVFRVLGTEMDLYTVQCEENPAVYPVYFACKLEVGRDGDFLGINIPYCDKIALRVRIPCMSLEGLFM